MHTLTSHEGLSEYNHKQMIEMDRHKWYLSEKAGRDLGATAYLDWISKYAKTFREHYLKEDRN